MGTPASFVPRHRRSTSREQLALVVAFLAIAWVAGALDRREIDISVYLHYAQGLAHGHLAQSLPKEYPAMAGGLLVLPWILPIPYPLAYSLLMLAILAAFLYVTRTHDRWQRRLLLYMALSCLVILFQRYDLVPMATIALAVYSAKDGRWLSAWLWAVSGGLLKLVPFTLLLVFIVAERRHTGKWPVRRAFITAGGLAAFAAIQQLLAPGTILSPLHYETSRGVEFSSFAGSLTLLTSPGDLTWGFHHVNLEISGRFHYPIGLALAAAALVACTLLLYALWHDMVTVEAASLLILTVVIASGKSFAPQYILWVAPLWAMWPLRSSWVVAAALTAVVYPYSFLLASQLHEQQPLYAATVLATVRNAALVAGTLAWLAKTARNTTTTSEPGRGSPSGRETLCPTHRPALSRPSSGA